MRAHGPSVVELRRCDGEDSIAFRVERISQLGVTSRTRGVAVNLFAQAVYENAHSGLVLVGCPPEEIGCRGAPRAEVDLVLLLWAGQSRRSDKLEIAILRLCACLMPRRHGGSMPGGQGDCVVENRSPIGEEFGGAV